jgi:hypothetical protein
MHLSRWGKVALIWILALVAIVSGGWLVWYVLYSPHLDPPPAPARPQVTQEPLSPNTYQRIRSEFGPWELAPPESTGAPALVMLRANGSTDVSSWLVSTDNAWTTIEPSWLAAITASEGQVQFRTDDGHTYTIAYGQPFMLERDLQRVFVVQRVGQGYRFVITTADHVRQAGHRK